MELLPPELLNQLPLLAQVFYEDDPMVYVKLSSPSEAWFFYICAIDDSDASVAGFVDSRLAPFRELQICPLNDLNELSRRWGTGESTVMQDVTFLPCRHSQVKLIWGHD